MERNIYDYLKVVKEATNYFTIKYHLDYEEVCNICLVYLIPYLSILENNKIVRNHFSAFFLTKLDNYFRENRTNLNNNIQVKKEGLTELESLVTFLIKEKKYPLYKVSDLLNLDGYDIGNILDNIDFRKKI